MLFELRASLDFYRLYEARVKECDQVIETFLVKYAPQVEVSMEENKQLKLIEKERVSICLALIYPTWPTNIFELSCLLYRALVTMLFMFVDQPRS
ncbi:hypothetical protein GCM10028808_62340 [Spirosoma migulaei]